jgi:hypothetical protein
VIAKRNDPSEQSVRQIASCRCRDGGLHLKEEGLSRCAQRAYDKL